MRSILIPIVFCITQLFAENDSKYNLVELAQSRSFKRVNLKQLNMEYEPQFLIIPAEDQNNCSGVFFYASHYAMDNKKNNKKQPTINDSFKHKGLNNLFNYFREDHNMAIIICNSFRPWSILKNQHKNEDQLPADKAVVLNESFDILADQWINNVNKICQDFQLPHYSESTWLLGGQSNGARYMNYLLPKLKSGTFDAVWIHGSSLYRKPSTSMSGTDYLITVAKLDSGFLNTIDYLNQCKKIGLDNTFVRADWGNHAATGITLKYAQKFYEWHLSGAKLDKNPYFADILNSEIVPYEKKNWIPETQRTHIPNIELANLYLSEPLNGGFSPIEQRKESVYKIKASSNIEIFNEWSSLNYDDLENLNVFRHKLKIKRNLINSISKGTAIVSFKNAVIGIKTKQRQYSSGDLEWGINFDLQKVYLFNDSKEPIAFLSIPNVKNWDEVEAELIYDKSKEKAFITLNGKTSKPISVKLKFEEFYRYGIGKLSDLSFGEMKFTGEL